MSKKRKRRRRRKSSPYFLRLTLPFLGRNSESDAGVVKPGQPGQRIFVGSCQNGGRIHFLRLMLICTNQCVKPVNPTNGHGENFDPVSLLEPENFANLVEAVKVKLIC